MNSVDLGEAHKAGAWSYEKSVPTIRWLDPRGVQRLSNQPRSLLPGPSQITTLHVALMTLSRAVYQDWRDYLANRDQKNGKPKKNGLQKWWSDNNKLFYRRCYNNLRGEINNSRIHLH